MEYNNTIAHKFFYQKTAIFQGFLRDFLFYYPCKSGFIKGGASRLNGFKKIWPKLFNFVVCNLCQSSPSLTILVPLWFIIISLVFSYLSIVLFSAVCFNLKAILSIVEIRK